MHSKDSSPRFRVASGQFHDFDAFAEAAESWDLTSHQLDRGGFQSDMVQASLGPVHLAYARFNRALEMHGEPPSRLRTFAILSERSSNWWWRGRETPRHAIMVYPVGAEIATVSRPGYEGYAVSIAEDHLEDVALAADLPSPQDLFRGHEVFECSPAIASALRFGLRACRETLVQLPETAQEQVRRELEFLLPTNILNAIANGSAERARSGSRFRTVVVDRVLDYVAAFPRQPLTVGDICRVAGASERTVQNGFLERFGLRPKAYLRDRRLNGARLELRTSDPHGTAINQVAHRWGFWHLGQFAGDYRRLFGELPSDTLRRRKKGD